jgi:hypothetical protein
MIRTSCILEGGGVAFPRFSVFSCFSFSSLISFPEPHAFPIFSTSHFFGLNLNCKIACEH